LNLRTGYKTALALILNPALIVQKRRFSNWRQWIRERSSMKLSTEKIITTHAGSMPRGEPLSSMLIDQEDGKRIDRRKIDEVTEERVAYIMKKENEVGIDIANDGEQGRVGFQTYMPQRMDGFGGESSRPFGREFVEFPKFTERMLARIPKTGKVFNAPEAVSELK
jgi:5-methyltetrahydropteroyltriglutamate--homocysteine methyltransferase